MIIDNKKIKTMIKIQTCNKRNRISPKKKPNQKKLTNYTKQRRIKKKRNISSKIKKEKKIKQDADKFGKMIPFFLYCYQFSIRNLKLEMNKKKEKKTPMFVSNINSNYQFVDYTTTSDKYTPPPISAFGNPNLQNQRSLSSQLGNVGSPYSTPSSEKENNWFEHFLQAHQSKNISSSNNGISSILETTTKNTIIESEKQNNKTNAQETTKGQKSPFNQLSQFPSNIPYDNSNSKFPSFKKEFETSLYQINSSTKSNGYINSNTNSQKSFNLYETPNKYNDNSYEFQNSITQFPKKIQSFQYQPNHQSSYTTYSRPQTYGYPPIYPTKHDRTLQKSASQPYYSTNSGGGFTHESIVQCLTEPYRSNVMAMIKRNKNRNN